MAFVNAGMVNRMILLICTVLVIDATANKTSKRVHGRLPVARFQLNYIGASSLIENELEESFQT
jgi:hypothetical protein